ncbi:MAG: response regulator [Glaciecola sp.]
MNDGCRQCFGFGLLERAEIVITDIAMGEKSGFDLIEYTKSINRLCKYIIVSMYENRLYLQQASALQVDAFIHKREAAHTLQKI